VPCPEPEVLSAFSGGRLDSNQQRTVEAHLDGCEACCRVVAELARIFVTDQPERVGHSLGAGPDRGPHDDTLTDESPPKKTRPQLSPGTRLDRYHILEAVGRGGMGVVYAAYDPDLDRKVALKVLHEREDADDDDRAPRRLLREAQAMARLSHPNVITVHEARAVDGRVFVSMEFVDGGTLGQWLATQAPELPRVLAMFRDVGRGLAAAHAAGLVHRDVKPDNVLVGTDERPRVTDFGLARPAEDEGDRGAGDARPSEPVDGPGGPLAGKQRLLDATLTRAGALVGTPAYMAPEQLRREPATSASDQFGFCVALWEALYGTRPFTGGTLFELATRVVSGIMTEPERDPGVPRWLRQVVLRGLSLRPEDRWPSMEALVERLELHPHRRRRGLLVVGATGAVLVTVSLLASRGLSAPADPCARGDRIIDELWTSGRRDEVQRALAQGATTYAEDTATLAVQRLDDYTAQWAASHRDACEDHHHGGQSDEALDLRGACLDERLRELRALVAVLGQADSEVRRHAVEAVDGLPPLGLCEDVPALRVRVPEPEDPDVRARVEELEDARAQVQAQLRAGRYEEGLRRAGELVEAARVVGYAPLLARALYDRSLLYGRQRRPEEATADLREAWSLALGAGDDVLAGDCSVELVFVLAHGLHRFDEAELRIEEARAMIGRVRRHDPRRAEALDANLDEACGQIELQHHRYAEAAALYERALAVVERQAGSDGLRVAQSLNALATARVPQEQWDQAMALFQRVLAIRTKHLGPAHPETAQTHNNLGLTLKNMGRLDEAAEQLERAHALVLASLGPSHPALRMAELNLAEVYHLQGRHREASDLYTLVFGPAGVGEIQDVYVLRRVIHYGFSLAQSGRLSQAREVLELAHARGEALGPRYLVRTIEVELAHIELESGRPERALARLDRLTPPSEDEPGDIVLDAALTRARALAASGELQQAQALLPEIRSAAAKSKHPDDLERLLARLDEDPPAR
jgi:tetratricopeptide (TPR) repeat protein